MDRTSKAAGMVASMYSCCCYVVFVFSIGVWDAKVAKTGKAARAASFNRVMLFPLNVVFVFSIGVQDTKEAKTGKTARAASFNRVMLFLLNVVFVFSIGI